jgi:hypothetical protein
MVEVKAVVKGTARLPCDIVPPVSNDSVFLVIWYKNDITPIYRQVTFNKLMKSKSLFSHICMFYNRPYRMYFLHTTY